MTDRSFRVGLLVVTVCGAVWRLGYLAFAKLGTPLLLNDSLYFSIQAGRNSEGDWFREGLTSLPGAEHGPLTSLWLTPWSLGGGDNVGWQRVAMTVLGIATIAVLGLVGRRLAGPVVGLVAAAVAAVYPNLWINDSLVMSESLAILLVSLALLVALDVHDAPTPGRCALLGVLVGLACLTRSELGLLAVGFAGLAWWRGAALCVVAAAARARPSCSRPTAVTVAPWVAYNLTQFDRPVLLSTNDGTTLLGANCDTTFYDDLGGWDLRCLAPVPTDDTVDASVRSAQRRDVAVDYVRDHATRVPVVVMARVGRVLDVYGLSSLVALDRGEEKAAWAVVGGHRDLVGRSPSRRSSGGAPSAESPPRPRSRWWLAVPLLTVLVTTVLFYGAHRIRAPAEPAVVVLAAVGLVAGWDRYRAGGTTLARRGRVIGWVVGRGMAHSDAVTAPDAVLDGKLDALRESCERLGRVVVAFSGGADSAFLAAVADATLGSAAAHAVTAVSPSLAGAERDDCRALAAEWGLRWTAGGDRRDGARRVPAQRHRPLLPLQGRADGRRRSHRRARAGDGRARRQRRRPR